MDETQQFLADLQTDEENAMDPFAHFDTNEPLEEEKEQEETSIQPKNRRERRLSQKAELERQSAIELAARLAKLEEAREAKEDPVYRNKIERIYGTDTPEAIAATDLFISALQDIRNEAKELALSEFRAEKEREARRVAEAEAELDTILEEIEDTYQVELSDAQEKSFFQMMQKMSPKDRDGNIVGLADPHAVFEVFQEKMNKRTENRAKDLSARSMTQGGSVQPSTLKDDSVERFLRQNGIIS